MLPPRIGALGLLRMEIGSLVMLLTAPCLGAASPAAASIIEENGPHSIVIVNPVQLRQFNCYSGSDE